MSSSKKYFVNLNLQENEIVDLKADTLDVTDTINNPASANTKRIVYWASVYYYSDGTDWIAMNGIGGGSVTSIATSSPITGGTITTSGTIGISQSTTSNDGYLSSTDWNTFNGKQNAFNGYGNEIHVSGVSGNDTNGNGELLNPYATITKALSVATNADLIIVHPATYNENPTSNVYAPLITINDSADKTIINGTLTMASPGRVKGFKINNLIVSNNNSTYIDDCNILTSFTKSGNGFVQIDNTTLQCSSGSLISGSGNTIINGDYLFPLVVNNAGANVIVKISNSCVAPSVLAGSLAIVDSILVAETPTGNAITSSAGTVVTLANTQVLVPTLDNVARVNLQGFYSIFNVIYDKPNSTLAPPSVSGGSTNSIGYFQYINADRFITQGGTSSQFVKGDGTLGTSVSGTVTSVGLTMPTAFTVSNSPITSSGDIAITGAGLVSQYVRGDGTLANFPNSTGGGSSINYYLNGSVSQGTFGGDTYYQMSKTPILGAGTDFTRTNGAGNGYIASFITDAGDPSFLNIPGGNWNVEFYFQSSASGGSPQFYAEIYKVSATNVFTLVASGSANPEGITNGTTVDQYFTSIPVPQTSLLITDRLAVRIYVITGGRTITLHTENGNLCEVLTTFTTGLTALNGLTDQVQFFSVGTSGTDFAISSVTDTHTFNLPTASASNRGALSTTDWTTFNNKIEGSGTANQISYFTASGTIASLTTATYPSLTELSYVKGVTSAIQTQIDNTYIARVQSVVSSATVTPTFSNDEVIITAQAVNLTLENPTGTATEGKSLIIRIKDNGVARNIGYGTQYRAIGVTLPTTTVANKTVYLGLIYNSTDTKWDVIGVSQEA